MGLLKDAIWQTVWVTLTFAWTFPLTVALEFLLPHEKRQPLHRLRGGAIWAVYFVLTGAVLAAEAALIGQVPLKPLWVVHVPGSGWAVGIVGVVLAAIVADFFYYWAHRAQHTRLLWPLHAVHHGIRDLNAVNSYHHWTEEIVRLPFVGLPLAFLVHIDAVRLPLASALIVLHSGYVHSASRLHFGPLTRLLADNRFHRIHHSIEDRHFGKNYCVFTTLWDQLFGTAHLPEKGEWPDTGLSDRAETDGIGAYLLARPTGTP